MPLFLHTVALRGGTKSPGLPASLLHCRILAHRSSPVIISGTTKHESASPYTALPLGLSCTHLNPKSNTLNPRPCLFRLPSRPPAFAFIEYSDTRDAQDAVAARDGYDFGGERIRVSPV